MVEGPAWLGMGAGTLQDPRGPKAPESPELRLCCAPSGVGGYVCLGQGQSPGTESSIHLLKGFGWNARPQAGQESRQWSWTASLHPQKWPWASWPRPHSPGPPTGI